MPPNRQPRYDLLVLLGLDRGEFGRPPSAWIQLQPCRAGHSCQTGLLKFMFVPLPYDVHLYGEATGVVTMTTLQ